MVKPPSLDVSPTKGAGIGAQLSPQQPSPGYAQRYAKASTTNRRVSGDAAAALYTVAQSETTGHAQLPGKDCSPLLRPRSAPKNEPLADSADSLCGHTTSEDEPRDTAAPQDEKCDQQGDGQGMDYTTTEPSNVESSKITAAQKSQSGEQMGFAEDNAALEAGSVRGNSEGTSSEAEPSEEPSHNTSTAEDVETQSEASPQPHEGATAQKTSSAKLSIMQILAEKRSVAAAYGGQATKKVGIWVQRLSCFKGAQPPSPRAAPAKDPTDPDEVKGLGILAHADSMLAPGQWRIGTQMEHEEVTLVAPPQLSRPLQLRKSKLPRLLSTAVSVAERLSLATAASLGRKRFSMPTFASHVKKAAEAEEGGHAAPAKGDAAPLQGAVSEKAPGSERVIREPSLSRLLVPQTSGGEEMKPREEVWKKVQHTRVSLVQLLDDSGPARPAAATQAAARGRPHLRVDTHTCSPRKAKQEVAAPKEDINEWFLPGSKPGRSLSGYLTLRNPVLPPTLLDPESPAPWRSRSPPSRVSTPLASPAKAATPKRGNRGGAGSRGLHLSPHHRQGATATASPGGPGRQGGPSPLKPAAAAALAHLKQTRIASVAHRRALSSSPQKSASQGSGRQHSWVSLSADRAALAGASQKQAHVQEQSVMANTLAVLHSHTQKPAKTPLLDETAARYAKTGLKSAASEGRPAAHHPPSQRLQTAGAEGAKRSSTSTAWQVGGSAKPTRNAQKAAPKDARQGSKKQGTALERAVLQQYLAARRGRGSYAASNLLRRGRIPGTDSPDLRSPAKAGAGAHAALEGEGLAAHEGLTAGEHTADGSGDERGQSADEQEREWERVQGEIAASLGAGHARTASSTASLTAQPLPQEERAEGTPSTGESAPRVPPNVAREIVRWESRNVMGLDHQLAALTEGPGCSSRPTSSQGAADAPGGGDTAGEPAGRAREEGTLSLELLDQLFMRDLAAGALREAVPPGPMETQCVPKALPLLDAWKTAGCADDAAQKSPTSIALPLLDAWEGRDSPVDAAPKSPSPSVVGEKLPFSPGSRLFAAVAARASAVQVPLDSDLKPLRLSSAFGEAAAACSLPAPSAAAATSAMFVSSSDAAASGTAHDTPETPAEAAEELQATNAVPGELRGAEGGEAETRAITPMLAKYIACPEEPLHSPSDKAPEFL